jgi:acyl-CoA synthetase (AMP-forming)/AMP-acid ligase II
MLENQNIYELVRHQAMVLPARNFVSDFQSSLSYAQAHQEIEQCAALMLTHDVTIGDRIVIVDRNSVSMVKVILAALMIGAVPVILHHKTLPANITKIADEVEPRFVICSSDLAVDWGAHRGVAVDELLQLSDTNIGSVEVFVPAVDDLALIIYTSGSTGKPRGVCLTHHNVRFVVKQIQQRLNYVADDVIGLFLPMSFDYGLYQLFLTAQVGAHLLIRDADSAGPALIKQLLANHVTVLPGVPNMLASLLKLGLRRKVILPNLRLVSNTGAHLADSYRDTLLEIMPNVEVYPMYGLTECKRVSILTPGDMGAAGKNSVGRPLDCTEAWVVDEKGQRLEAGKFGELVVAGPHVGAGYWRAPQETSLRYRYDSQRGETVLYTGDTFTIDDGGYLYYVGRMDDQIKRSGFRINKLEIEQAALTIQGVLSAFSLLISDDDYRLFISVTDSDMTKHGVLRKLSEILEPYKVPDQVHILPELPKNNNGKVDQAALRAMT